jgi:hypothetical protein
MPMVEKQQQSIAIIIMIVLTIGYTVSARGIIVHIYAKTFAEMKGALMAAFLFKNALE